MLNQIEPDTRPWSSWSPGTPRSTRHTPHATVTPTRHIHARTPTPPLPRPGAVTQTPHPLGTVGAPPPNRGTPLSKGAGASAAGGGAGEQGAPRPRTPTPPRPANRTAEARNSTTQTATHRPEADHPRDHRDDDSGHRQSNTARTPRWIRDDSPTRTEPRPAHAAGPPSPAPPREVRQPAQSQPRSTHDHVPHRHHTLAPQRRRSQTRRLSSRARPLPDLPRPPHMGREPTTILTRGRPHRASQPRRHRRTRKHPNHLPTLQPTQRQRPKTTATETKTPENQNPPDRRPRNVVE